MAKLKDTNMQDYNSAVADLKRAVPTVGSEVCKDKKFQALSEEEQTKLITSELTRIQKEVLEKYQDES